ncbi:hypothetical protein TMatcc_007023 [Talaromyces marneffei ATCC 18224]|uniref:Spermine/spermidine synthase family protein n=1 Tax=Talaromyces marneffei (strain ATCC 18224 / CBS 334.59 / QM 7333) TaxID=441960 RepID=B6QEE6_TALMQ|nr:spermine/spermidine synthase family protein [Talaromyces marneffei ATCC 18224]KAE8553535.1 hypothetical protein EYB25_004917 [Talaromyces marneffei]
MVKQRTSKFQDGRGTIPEEPAMSRSLHIWKEVSRALVLPILAAAYSRVSLLALAPVYGSTPSRVWHDVLCNTAILAGSFSPESLRKIENILPGLALSIPVFQSFLFQRSSLFGNPTGPVLTELMTIFPFLLFSTSSYLKRIERLNLGQRHPLLTGCIFALYGVLAFRLADTAIQSLLPAYIGSTVWMTTFGMQSIIALLYAINFSSYLSWGLFILPTTYLFITADPNILFVHAATRVNSTLHGVGYSLVDRQESLTGYISVLDNVELGFRAMRCDHSLLGGEWTHRPSHYNPRVSDPIYAVFTMLEAVRLVESDPELPKKEDKDRNALVIGLGIGTTPAALIQHGIETTIVEIDPVVYRFAVQHFHFPPNHTAVIDNAISFVETARHESKKYDYIIHDVFTGGVEPIELFTLEFIQGLEALLAEDGVVAINYAGDISLPGAGVVIRTIKAVFPECRIFRENDGSELPAEESFDFINMVVFCKKNRTSPLTFRLPNEEDYLGSQARKSYMYPRREIDSRIFDIGDDSTDQRILEVGNTSILEASHIPNAIGHWNIMRDVLPAKVWENF